MSESVIEKSLIAESTTFPLQMLIDTGSKGTRVKLHHTTAILPTSQMSTDEPNDLSLA